jgi:hypothetical protein
MSLVRRIVVAVAALGVFHSSLVPPVKQSSGALCRYHEFMERGWPFTREYGATGVDGIALLTEYGIILSLAALIYLLIGMVLDRNGTKVAP